MLISEQKEIEHFIYYHYFHFKIKKSVSLCFCMVGKISAVIRTTLQKKVWQGNAKNTECAICDLLVAGA